MYRTGSLKEFFWFCMVDLGLDRKTALLYRAKVSEIIGSLGKDPYAEFRRFLMPLDRGYANNYIKVARIYFIKYLGRGEFLCGFRFVSPSPAPPRYYSKKALQEFYWVLGKQRDRVAFPIFATSGRRCHGVLGLKRVLGSFRSG